MPMLKPIRAIQLNRSHPLARGLVGCWLFNEGAGDKVFDLSGQGNHGTLKGDPVWVGGKFGSCLDYDGTGDYVQVPDIAFGQNSCWTVSAWLNWRSDDGSYVFPFGDHDSNYESFMLRHWLWVFAYRMTNGTYVYFSISSSDYYQVGWFHIAFVSDGTNLSLYLNGKPKETVGISNTTLTFSGIGQGYNNNYEFNGLIDDVKVYERFLSVAEIARLYREPFCMFDEANRLGLLCLAGQIVWLTAASTATASAHGSLTRCRKLAGIVSSAATLSGILTLCYRGQVERQWLIDALFNGMTTNAFKLGTVMTGGWFWMRRAGCSALYRGPSMEQMDFANILAVAEQEVDSISPPGYMPHHSSSTYFYVVRRFNNCGYQERTLAAAVKVSIDSEGDLAKPQPNNIFTWRVDQVDGNKTELTWFYCPLEQKSRPALFKVYYDGGTGLIDYQNPIATVNFRGRKFYTYQSDALPAGRYLFAVRAEDADGIQDNSLAQLAIQISNTTPDAINILSAEV